MVLLANVKLRYLRPKFAEFSTTTGTQRKRWTEWRRGWDSNPRDPFGPNGFQDRRVQPDSATPPFTFNHLRGCYSLKVNISGEQISYFCAFHFLPSLCIALMLVAGSCLI